MDAGTGASRSRARAAGGTGAGCRQIPHKDTRDVKASQEALPRRTQFLEPDLLYQPPTRACSVIYLSFNNSTLSVVSNSHGAALLASHSPQ